MQLCHPNVKTSSRVHPDAGGAKQLKAELAQVWGDMTVCTADQVFIFGGGKMLLSTALLSFSSGKTITVVSSTPTQHLHTPAAAFVFVMPLAQVLCELPVPLCAWGLMPRSRQLEGGSLSLGISCVSDGFYSRLFLTPFHLFLFPSSRKLLL